MCVLTGHPHGTNATCSADQWQCGAWGVCVPAGSRCDGVADCPHAEDEAECACAPGAFRCATHPTCMDEVGVTPIFQTRWNLTNIVLWLQTWCHAYARDRREIINLIMFHTVSENSGIQLSRWFFPALAYTLYCLSLLSISLLSYVVFLRFDSELLP